MIYSRQTGFGMLVFFTNGSLTEFQVRYSALFLLLLVIDVFKWFWMGILHKNFHLMLEFLKAPFLVLHFPYYTLMTFLMMLSAILLSMLIILHSILVVIRYLICGNNLNNLNNSELESDQWDTVDWGTKWFVDFNAGKTQLILFDLSNYVDVKMDGSVLEEKSSFKMLCLTLCFLNWIVDLTLSLLLKLPSRKLEA